MQSESGMRGEIRQCALCVTAFVFALIEEWRCIPRSRIQRTSTPANRSQVSRLNRRDARGPARIQHATLRKTPRSCTQFLEFRTPFSHLSPENGFLLLPGTLNPIKKSV